MLFLWKHFESWVIRNHDHMRSNKMFDHFNDICRLCFFLDRFSTFFTFGMVCPFLFLTGNHPILFAGKVSIQFCLLWRYPSSSVWWEGTYPVMFGGKVPIQFCFLWRYLSGSVFCEGTHPVLFAAKVPIQFCMLGRYLSSSVFWYLSSFVF